jgi:prevent-host-death family protein
MSSISIIDAKKQFGEILDRAVDGESFVITQDEKPLVQVLPVNSSAPRRDVKEVVAALLELQERIRERTKNEPTLTDEEVRSAIDEGRM